MLLINYWFCPMQNYLFYFSSSEYAQSIKWYICFKIALFATFFTFYGTTGLLTYIVLC